MKRILTLFKTLLAILLKYPKIMVPVGVILLILLIWFAGPSVGITRIDIRLFLVIGVLFAWILFLMIERMREDKGAKLLEQSMKKQAEEQLVNARPDRKEDIQALQSQLEKAIASLKQSKLGKGYRGSTALYALPWYMIIGPPASGKSTALKHSGLQFPAMDTTGKGVQGVGGTRNCDWWFTNEAILLDTAGRYVTEDEDREEWIGFLDLLKQYRKKKPINGVLAAISIADLFQANDEEIEWHAKNIRNRIDELIQRLGITFPVYLIFTKCDLIRGFVESFEDMNKSEREQIWGVTLPQRAMSGTTSHQIFDTEFKLLCQSLHSKRMGRLTSAWGSQKIRDIYSFPLQLSSGHERLKRFVELLFQQNTYHENPVFRGFYFTSGTQEGAPIDRIIGAMGRASGLPDVISEVFEAHKEPKSYFLKNLFTDVIFPDHLLAGPSSSAGKKQGYMKVGVFAGSAAATIIALIGLSFSFVGNKHLLGAVNSAINELSKINILNEGQFVTNISYLDRLRTRVEQLQTYDEEGIPLRLRGGLYRGDTIYPAARTLYFEHFNNIFLDSTRSAMDVELEGFVSNPNKLPANRDSGYYYSVLKAYLMMSEPAHIEPVFLDQWLQKIWRDFLIGQYGEGGMPDGLSEAVSRQISFYTHQSTREGMPRLQADQRLIEQSRQILRSVPLIDRLYNRIRSEASEKLKPYTLETALHGKGGDILVSDYSIPGVFTPEGLKTSFMDTTTRVISESGQEAWVLGVPESTHADIESAITRRYFNEYAGQWESFMISIRIRPVSTLPDMVKQLEVLAGKESPIVELLNDVVKNTDIGGGGGAGGLAQGFLQKVKKGLKMGQSEQGSSASASSNPVSSKFHSVHEFARPSGEQKEALLTQYMKELNGAQYGLQSVMESGATGQDEGSGIGTSGASELFRASKNTEKLLQELDPEGRRIIGPLLLQPFQVASAGLMGRAQEDLNRRWRSDVYEPCVQTIANRYPFSKGGEDAAFVDIADFFHPTNGILWKFYEKEIKPFVIEDRDQWRLKSEKGAGVSLTPELLENLRQARIISESLFQRGNPDPQFTFEIYPYPTPGVSEILLRMNGEELRYRNEPQEWHKLTWPGTSASAGTLLQLVYGGNRQSQQYQGQWGLFKLLSSGRITQVSTTTYRVEWDFSAKGLKGMKIQYDIRAGSYKNPFKPGLFTHFRCMERLG